MDDGRSELAVAILSRRHPRVGPERRRRGVRGLLGLIVVPLLIAATYTTPDNRPLPIDGQRNGELPASILVTVTPRCVAYAPVAADLQALLADAAKAKVALVPRECYRTLANQVYWRNYWCELGTCQYAAVPGTSNHGWGKAVDFGVSLTEGLTFNSPGFLWLKANGWRYNLNHPGWAAKGTDSEEPWHWEWVGDGGTLFGKPPVAVASSGPVGRNADGRLEVFGTGVDGSIRSSWQSPGSPSGWSPLARFNGAFLKNTVQVISNADGRLEVFGQGTDRVTYHAWQLTPNGSWSGFAPLGAVSVGPALGRSSDGRLELFTVDSSGTLRRTTQTVPNGPWNAPVVLGTGFAGPPGLGATRDGRLAVYAVGPDGRLRGLTQVTPSGPFGSPVTIGYGAVGRPAVGANDDGRMEVFVRGTDGRLWHSWAQNGGMSPLERVSDAPIEGDPIVTRSQSGRLEVFSREPGGRLGHTWQLWPNGPWSGWFTMSDVAFGGPPSIAVNADGRFEIFLGGPDPTAWHSWQLAPDYGWSGFHPLHADFII